MTEERERRPFRRGDRIRIRPEWQDPGDDEFGWVAVEDEDGGRVRVMALLDLPFPGTEVVTIDMIEHADNEN